jgi:hypothetical protein
MAAAGILVTRTGPFPLIGGKETFWNVVAGEIAIDMRESFRSVSPVSLVAFARRLSVSSRPL